MLHSRVPKRRRPPGARIALEDRPTSYFDPGRPKKGLSKFQFAFDDAVYWFGSADHRARFAADPERYAPQYGAYCAVALAGGEQWIPDAWSISNGNCMFSDRKRALRNSIRIGQGSSAKRVQIGKRCTYPNEHSRPDQRPASFKTAANFCDLAGF